MNTSLGPQKGDSAPLRFTQKSRHRVVVGLSWDPRADKATFMDRLKGTHEQHDLDVLCFIFDKDKNYIDYVGAEAEHAMDQSGKIYHSGDDMTGEGDGDDEFISVEFADLPEDIAHMVFIVEIRSNHHFKDVDAPEVRVADGMSNENLFHSYIATQSGQESKAFIAVKLSKSLASETGWDITNISDYPDTSDIQSWGGYLARYL